ncbi:MAG: 9-O-acetylesterase, partial [Bacteroidota bacterium]
MGATAEVILPRVISDGMVLQRDKEVRIWGWADPNETVTLDFQGEQYQATADARGNFSFIVGPYPVGGPYALTITGSTNSIELSEVYLGEVWLCSGQSNMEWPLYRSEGAEEEIATANEPRIRLFQV